MALSTLEHVPVNESLCRERTDKILSEISDLKNLVIDLKIDYNKHRAWHNGQETADERVMREKANNTSTVVMVAKWLSLGLMFLSLAGTIIWYFAKGPPV